MIKSTVAVASVATMLFCATSALAQSGAVNPFGLDAGPFHPPIPAQVTTYIPPERPAVAPHRSHYRKHHR